MFKAKKPFFKKHLSWPVTFGKRQRQVNYGLIILVVIASATAWWFTEYCIYRLGEVDPVVREWVSEVRPVSKAQTGNTYYFSVTGTDPGVCNPSTCTDYLNPCKTIECADSIENSLADGAHLLLFRSGDKWNTDAEWGNVTKLRITTAGIDATEQFIIGTYDPADGSRVTRTDIESGMLRAHISGDKDGDNGWDRPGDRWQGLIFVNGADHVRVENIELSYSYGRGIRWEYGADYGYAHNIVTSWTQGGGLGAYQATDLTVDYSDLSYGCAECYCSGYGQHNLTPADHWPAALACSSDSTGCIFRFNKVHENWGEGIGFFKGSHNGLAENNITYANRSVQIYVANTSNCVVRYNLAYGTTDSRFHRFSSSLGPGQGLAVNVESPTYWAGREADNNQVYGNLVAGCETGIRNAHNVDDYNMTGNEFFNNTFVDNVKNFQIQETGGGAASISAVYRNNASIKFQGVYPTHDDLGGNYNIAANYNFWTETPSAPIYDPATDQIFTNPGIEKNSGWQSLSADDLDGTEFRITDSNSRLIDTGTDYGDSYALPVNGSTWNDHLIILQDPDQYGSSWEIGACVYISAACTDADSDGYDTCAPGDPGDDGNPIDCDDNEYWAKPGGTETCDTVDNDCSGIADEECDNDSDGYCDNSMPIWRYNTMCPNTVPFVGGMYGDDCDDTNGNINPGVTEICANSVDDDCDGLTDECGATIYYFSQATGDDNNPCSQTNPCRTIEKANSLVLGPGDNLLFKRGEVWSPANGGFGNAARLYIEDTEDGISGDRITVGAYGTGVDPVIDGENIQPAAWQGLISNYGDYVDIRNIDVRNSNDSGIWNEGDYVIISGLNGDYFVRSCIRLSHANNCTIENNDCQRHGVTETPASISLDDSDNNLVQNNTVHEGWGEGIGFYVNSDSNIAQYNTVYATYVNIYVDNGRNNVVRYNLVYEVVDDTYYKNHERGLGITLNCEAWHNSVNFSNNDIYGNFIAGQRWGISVSAQNLNATLTDSDIYNNTIVDCEEGIRRGTTYGTPSGNNFKNNIVWKMTDTLTLTAGQRPNGFNSDYNLWSHDPEEDSWEGTNDPSWDTPLLSKSSGWRSLTAGTLLADDFQLQAPSPAVDTGTPLSSPYNVDYFGTSRPQGSGWDIGAHEYAGTSGATDCHRYTPTDPVQAGYGSAYNLADNNPSELLVRTACNTGSVNLDVGNGNANMLIYERGHIYDGSDWQGITLSGASQPYTGWYAGNAGASDIPAANMSAINYIVAYTCYWNGQSWRCGCADSACIDPCPGSVCGGKTGGLWQLQAFSQ